MLGDTQDPVLEVHLDDGATRWGSILRAVFLFGQTDPGTVCAHEKSLIRNNVHATYVPNWHPLEVDVVPISEQIGVHTDGVLVLADI